MTNRWSLKKAAIWGAVLSPLGLIASSLLNGQDLPNDPAGFIGFIIGGVLAGAFMFWAVAAIRNSFGP